MDELTIRDFRSDDADRVLELNHDSVHFLAPMDATRLKYLLKHSEVFWIAEKDSRALGFFIGFTDGSEYDSSNYRWFTKHLKNFLYIDRIVVSEKARGTGIGRELYAQIERWSRENMLTVLAAEIDVEPPNPVSLKFHRAQGFRELHQQRPGGADKIVSLQAKFLSAN